MEELVDTHGVQSQHHHVQDQGDIPIPAGTWTRSPYPSDSPGRTASQRTLGSCRVHVDPQHHDGTTLGHSQREVPDLLAENGVHVQGKSCDWVKFTIGEASMVLVPLPKERNIQSIVIQMVRAMESNHLQTPSLDTAPIRVAPPLREARNPEGSSDRQT